MDLLDNDLKLVTKNMFKELEETMSKGLKGKYGKMSQQIDNVKGIEMISRNPGVEKYN